ncbi:MAG: hypothetical protein Q8910_00335 [Bacteroidota bacterium]|nr:hypothetical protein [Bacteroidota bacterium]
MAKKGKLIIPEKFKDLIGTQSPDGIGITEDNLRTALTKLVSCRRRPMGKSATLESIYETIEPEHIFKNIKSAGNLKSGVVENITKPEKKTEELKSLSLDYDELAGYNEDQKKFINSRLEIYKADLPNLKEKDRPILFQTVFYEMMLAQINLKMLSSPKDFADLQKQMEFFNVMILKNQDSLNALKKQVENPRNSKSEETKDGGLADILKKLDEQMDNLGKEDEEDFQEELKMLDEKRKRG